ncbi:hypothetical protein APD36_06530 [Acinetobacter pittii]|uniref:hypothetical protein n=1 Tax=Acinetobacter pittii TaxID=48296 RepID=UPI000707A2A4|nr:hypothetical protein [Acinetobacter pittii]KQE16774.1 hypothetical protein APD36_06530 [Acinetobacter pittii]
MPRIVSVVPPNSGNDITMTQGTTVLLDNGEHLRHIHKITLVAEPLQPWKAIIEVYPTNQEQINALLEDVEVIKRDQANSRLDVIEKEIQQLQDEKVLIERDRRSKVTGLSIAGVANIPLEGTFLVDKQERVLNPPINDDLTNYLKNNPHHSTVIPPVTRVVKDIHGVVRAVPDLKGEQDDSEEHY